MAENHPPGTPFADTYHPPAGGPIEAMACAVCGHVVDTVTEEFGPVEVDRRWQHTLAFAQLDADHVVVQVPVDWIRTNFVCDFCLADNARWALPVEPFGMAADDRATYSTVDDWAACDICAEALRFKDWNKIIYRAMKAHKDRGGPMRDRRIWEELYRMLRRHITGPVQLHIVKPEGEPP